MQLSDEQVEWLTLSMIPGVGTAKFIRLLARFHSPGEVLRASVTEVADVVGEELAVRISQYKDVVDISGQERAMKRWGAQLVTLEDASYPSRLAEIYDPPLTLFIRGTLTEGDERSIAIVGTRKPSSYGLQLAEEFAEQLAARGFTIISGLASGIDTAAHRGALRAKGRTIAVLGNGVDIVFPPENRALMDEIIQNGCVLSQFPMGMKPRAEYFPYRNRIISGLSLGTLVIEAPARSGALITAQLAAEQGREVFAVPGPVNNVNSVGPHRLIQEGAKLVQTVDDILIELEQEKPGVETLHEETTREFRKHRPVDTVNEEATKPAPARTDQGRFDTAVSVSPQEKDILSALSPEGSFVDEIAMACRIPISEALSSLTLLEMKGLVRQFSGKRFAPR